MSDAAAAREQEIAEEEQYERERSGSAAVPSIAGVYVTHPAKLVREWVRSVLVPPAIKRLYDTGMGIEKFDTPTALGNIVRVEAPPAVQVKALATLVAIGVPTQLGLIDGSGGELPGVIALGPLDMDAARQDAHGDRYVSAETHARVVAQHHNGNGATNGNGNGEVPPLRPMADRVAAGEFEVHEVNEGIGVIVQQEKHDPETPPPDPRTLPLTPEQRLLANRQARRRGDRIPYPEE